MNSLVPTTGLADTLNNIDINSISSDAKSDYNIASPTIQHSKKIKRQQEINEKLEAKIKEEELSKDLKKKNIDLKIKRIQAKRDSFIKSQEEEKLLIEYKEKKDLFERENKEREIKKIKIKFETALSKFKNEYTASDGKVYSIPKYSCVINESNENILKFLLDERSKKASWLKLSKKDIKNKDWMSLIDQELETKFQLDKKDEKDENAKIHLSLLNEYSLIQLKNPQPAPSQSKPSEPTSPQSTVEKKNT